MSENLLTRIVRRRKKERLAKTNFRDVRPFPSMVEGEGTRSPARRIKCWKPVLGPGPAKLYSLLVLKKQQQNTVG